MKSLFFETLIKLLLGFIFLMLLLFMPIGTFNYWNAWLLLGLLFIPMIFIGTILFIKNPNLLKKRLHSKETQNVQKRVIAYTFIVFILGFIMASLDYKYKLSNIPYVIVIIASIIFIFSYILYAEVIRENEFLSRTIEVQKNQKIIDTGLYGIIRHPMYLASILMFLSMPIILGSVYSFIIFLNYPLIIIIRINNEEKVLENELKGYKEYKNKVKYRLIPFIF